MTNDTVSGVLAGVEPVATAPGRAAGLMSPGTGTSVLALPDVAAPAVKPVARTTSAVAAPAAVILRDVRRRRRFMM